MAAEQRTAVVARLIRDRGGVLSYRALDALGTDPGSTVHVGNSLTSDVPGAQAAGLRAAWLSDGSTPDPVPAYTLDSMTALHDPPWQTR